MLGMLDRWTPTVNILQTLIAQISLHIEMCTIEARDSISVYRSPDNDHHYTNVFGKFRLKRHGWQYLCQHALCLMGSEKKIKCLTHFKSMEANDSWGMAILDTRSMESRIYAGNLHLSCGSCCFRKYHFKGFFSIMTLWELYARVPIQSASKSHVTFPYSYPIMLYM